MAKITWSFSRSIRKKPVKKVVERERERKEKNLIFIHLISTYN